MELKPGTPEYQEAYDKEMKRLDAEAGKDADKKADKPDEITSKADDKADKPAEKKADDVKADPETVARLEKLEKALKDTQRWGHDNAAEVKRLKKEAEDRKRAETRPAILDANPGLEDAIKHFVKPAGESSREEGMAAWRSTVSRAIPDVEQLLGDKDFYAKAAAKKSEFGDEWDDPITAIRELSSIRTEHLSNKSVQVAVEAARKDFEVKSKRRNAMEVPGGSGGDKGAPAKEDDEVKRFKNMTRAELDKERSRVLGY